MSNARELSTTKPLVSGTALATTSGTSFDFTSIPSWVKRITITFSEVSTSGSTNIQLLLGTTGGFESTGYISQIGAIVGSAASTSGWTTGFVLANVTGTNAGSGHAVLTKVSGNSWALSAILKCSTNQINFIGGSKTVSGALDRIRLNCTTGTDAFDAGSVNILYE